MLGCYIWVKYEFTQNTGSLNSRYFDPMSAPVARCAKRACEIAKKEDATDVANCWERAMERCRREAEYKYFSWNVFDSEVVAQNVARTLKPDSNDDHNATHG